MTLLILPAIFLLTPIQTLSDSLEKQRRKEALKGSQGFEQEIKTSFLCKRGKLRLSALERNGDTFIQTTSCSPQNNDGPVWEYRFQSLMQGGVVLKKEYKNGVRVGRWSDSEGNLWHYIGGKLHGLRVRVSGGGGAQAYLKTQGYFENGKKCGTFVESGDLETPLLTKHPPCKEFKTQAKALLDQN